jgi:hypothetical protein
MTWKGHIQKLRRNRRGGIEGLPLQLMIIILVAALGTAIIVGWMSSIETPRSIGSVETEPGSIQGTSDVSIRMTVTDQDGNPLEGAVVVLTGLGIIDSNGRTPNAMTDSGGTVQFSGLKITGLAKGRVGYLDAEATKPGYGSRSVQIVVIN